MWEIREEWPLEFQQELQDKEVFLVLVLHRVPKFLDYCIFQKPDNSGLPPLLMCLRISVQNPVQVLPGELSQGVILHPEQFQNAQVRNPVLQQHGPERLHLNRKPFPVPSVLRVQPTHLQSK